MPGSSGDHVHAEEVVVQAGRGQGRGRGRGRGRPRIHPVPISGSHPPGRPRKHASEGFTNRTKPPTRSVRKSFFKQKAASRKETQAVPQDDTVPLEVTRAQTIVKAYTLHELESSFQQMGLGLIMLEAGEGMVAAKLITVEQLFASLHLLLPFDVADGACGVCGQMVQLACSWPHDMPGLGNELWESFITPTVHRALSGVTAGRLKPALADLLGLLLFMVRDDCWLCQQEAYKDWTMFCNLFDDLSAAWSTLLSQDDSVLGISPKEGRPGGYRNQLKSILRQWRQRTNAYLEANFNNLETPVKEPRRRVMAKS